MRTVWHIYQLFCCPLCFMSPFHFPNLALKVAKYVMQFWPFDKTFCFCIEYDHCVSYQNCKIFPGCTFCPCCQFSTLCEVFDLNLLCVRFLIWTLISCASSSTQKGLLIPLCLLWCSLTTVLMYCLPFLVCICVCVLLWSTCHLCFYHGKWKKKERKKRSCEFFVLRLWHCIALGVLCVCVCMSFRLVSDRFRSLHCAALSTCLLSVGLDVCGFSQNQLWQCEQKTGFTFIIIHRCLVMSCYYQ